ncbi:unnamed protein product [Camellia sinensis]
MFKILLRTCIGHLYKLRKVQYLFGFVDSYMSFVLSYMNRSISFFSYQENRFISYSCVCRSLYDSHNEMQENKIKCITHYFERICSCMPVGVVSFERKVLPLENSFPCVSYPKADFWSTSSIPLCRFKVYRSGLIEDQSCEALEVDFANKYLGGGALHRGCVQVCFHGKDGPLF